MRNLRLLQLLQEFSAFGAQWKGKGKNTCMCLIVALSQPLPKLEDRGSHTLFDGRWLPQILERVHWHPGMKSGAGAAMAHFG